MQCRLGRGEGEADELGCGLGEVLGAGEGAVLGRGETVTETTGRGAGPDRPPAPG
jgi:hypothetical protein